MVDFNTLKGVDGYRAAFPAVFDGMSDADAKKVVRAVHSSVLEGWEPSAQSVQDVSDRILRDGPSWMTPEEIDALVAQVTAAKSA
jgi:cell filamentation protein